MTSDSTRYCITFSYEVACRSRRACAPGCLFTGGSDGSLRAFDADFVCYWQTRVCDSGITCMTFSSSSLLHIGCDNGRVLTYKSSRCSEGWSVAMHSGRVQAIDATDHHTASLSDDGTVVLADNDAMAFPCSRCGVMRAGLA